MVYLLLCFFCSLYMYSIQNYKASLIVLLPPFILYFLISALQYNVGSDYFSYLYIYENQWVLGRYFESGEYFFYYLNIFLKEFGFPGQSIFFIFSFFQSIFVFVYFNELKKKGFIIWMLFLIFFVVTNIYNNQMNGIRQYAALTLLPLLTIFIYNRSYIYFGIFMAIAMSFHSSSLIFLSLIIFVVFHRSFHRYNIVIFILSIPFYLLVAKYTPILLENLGLRFSSYIESDYFDAGNYITIITKIYYFPVLLFFYYLYGKARENTKKNHFDGYFSFLIFMFSCTYWSFLMSLDIAILSRVSSYFWFFIIFPLYYVGIFLHKKGIVKLGLYIIYLVAPYAAKVTFLAKNEFLYNSIIFN
ncbi:EpsG family protein [Aeromonas dhakensis]|uniref:EpsG family protein n=1 Tax=Aeromonas dhakensis TaxID=196024 RepID=UPI0038D0AAE2